MKFNTLCHWENLKNKFRKSWSFINVNMKLSSVKELIIQLMYAVYMQNYNVTVLFKEKNLIFIPKNKL